MVLVWAGATIILFMIIDWTNFGGVVKARVGAVRRFGSDVVSLSPVGILLPKGKIPHSFCS